jgi:Raf kinase inhibitor-like YbhB/YbcL family protein
MQIESRAFADHQPIPKKYSCEGADLSPPLTFRAPPAGTKTFALIVEDPDAPSGVFDHWIAWNLSPETRELEEGAKVPKQGKNHYGEFAYRGPCPPRGKPHRYFFKLYALDTAIERPDGITKKELEEAMEGHLLATAELVGLYQR